MRKVPDGEKVRISSWVSAVGLTVDLVRTMAVQCLASMLVRRPPLGFHQN